jgi:hypothetical protein
MPGGEPGRSGPGRCVCQRRFFLDIEQNPGELDMQQVDPENFVAPGPLRHCCLRYDFGLPIIHSDYLPRNVVGLRWDGS